MLKYQVNYDFITIFHFNHKLIILLALLSTSSLNIIYLNTNMPSIYKEYWLLHLIFFKPGILPSPGILGFAGAFITLFSSYFYSLT